LTGLLFSQSIEANWQLGAAIVEYTYVVRDSASAEDATAVYEVTGSWPSSAAAAAGMGYTHPLVEYDVGDTITTVLVPLINETFLAMFGVAMNVNLNDDNTFTINDGSTYPTTETLNCSTYATVPSVAEAGTWIGTPGFDHPDDANAHTMGWGISLSSVFAQFNAPDLVGGTYGVDYGVGTAMENWGMVTVDYTDATHATPAGLEMFWEAHDGVASGLGVDDAGELNGVTGVPVAPSDTVTIGNMEMYLMYMHPDTNLWYNLGWTGDEEGSLSWPMLGGSGHPIDPTNPDSYEINPMTGDTTGAGQVDANWGYIFDPMGGDGALFSGDEPLAPTGYFFTYNFLEASSIFSEVMGAHLAAGAALDAALAAAADSVAFIYVDAATSAAIAASVSSSLYADYVACAGAGGGAACNAIFAAGPTMTLIGVQQACGDYDCGVDDSGWDYDAEDGTGRLVFEIDNNCIPDNTTQRVNTFWANTQLEVDEEAPLAQKFEVYGNYPNPFNPSTQIKFATEKSSDVTITIYSILGQEMTVLQNGILNAGTYNISWFGTDHYGNKVPSGVYFYEVRSDNRIQKGKMLLLK
jgi:hypothetical protein